ncbi:MAG: carbamate kinase [Candidatus Diapherotrites archaeon]
METLVIALGGNALIKHHQIGNYKQQLENVKETSKQIAKLIKKGYCVILTHGNGPQVGNLQIQMIAASEKVPAMPLDVDVAMTQAQIGYMLQQSLRNEIPAEKVATIVTEIVVDKNDSAFRKPTKPIGPYYKSKSELKKAKIKNFIYVKGKGYRKIVASPKPKKIIQLESVKKLSEKKRVVICCGGGGIPVVKKGNDFFGVEAVIDKDRTASLLAKELKAKTLVILTDVEFVYLNFGKKNQKKLRNVKLKEMKNYLKEGHFSEGSMKPKIESAIEFIENSGKEVIITSLNKLLSARNGKTGTRVIK